MDKDQMIRELSGRVTFRVFKRGLLSRVAHDLQLSIALVKAWLDGDKVYAELPLRSFVVDGAIKGGRVVSGVISSKDTQVILNNMHSDVLQTEAHPAALLEGKIDQTAGLFQGLLTLRGRPVEITFPVRVGQESFEGTVEVTPTRWGISPYSALMGAIQLQDRVEVGFEFGTSERNR